MVIKIYDAAREVIRGQLHLQQARQMLDDPTSIDTQVDAVKKSTLSEAMFMSMGVLARLDVINDPANDQAQASARDLVNLLAGRLNIDAETRFGVPLK